MKIKLNHRYPTRIRLLLMIMRAFIFFFCTTVFSFSSHNVFSQEKIVVNEDQLVTVDEVFKLIKHQTDYKFIYPKRLFKNAQRVQLKKGEILVTELLQQSLSSNNLSFELTPGNTIIIKVKPPPIGQHNLQPIQQEISGTVTDIHGALPGVTITVKGQSTLSITDQNGRYSIAAMPTDSLVYSFVGYKTVTVAINGKNIIDTVLPEEETALQEVMVNAGYYTVKARERTGSIQAIKTADIEKQPVSNILAAMQGRMAGVDIIQESGTAGGGFQIRIRGINSLRADGNEPLYIINGVPYSAESIGSTGTSGFAPSQTSPLNSINPADIESIEVLKDADATAIYGSRGANGVVLITTKRGKAGKAKFTVNASTGVGTVTTMLDLMKTEKYLEMRRKAFENDNVTTLPANAYDVNGTWDQERYTDWQQELIGGTAEITNLQASVTGGSRQTQYLLSGNYRTETTVLPGDFEYNKGSAHFSMNHGSDDEKFKLTFTADYVVQRNDQPAADLTILSRTLAPNAPALYDEEGNLNWENNTWTNPLARLESKFGSRINNLNANAVLSYSILPDLQLKANLGFNDLVNNERRTLPSTMYTPAFGMGPEASILYSNVTGRQSWIIEPQISYVRSFSSAKIDALLGGTFQNQRTNRLYQSGQGFSSNSLINDLASAIEKNVSLNDESLYKYQAFFARVNLNWDARYIVNLTGRRDGSSRFGPGKQFANFGAAGAAWIFSNESLLEDSKVLSFGKLRASYGITGNDQIGDYQFLDTYSASGNNYNGVVALQPARLYNPAFGWESNKKLEAALELGFFRDRIFVTAAYYKNRSSDQLVGIPLPGTTGFPSLNANLDATVENRGFEFTLRTINFDKDKFKWTTSLNVSKNENELISFPGLATSSYATTYRIGHSLNIYRLYHYTRINPTTGVYEFEDFNGDGVITSLDDREKTADFTPSFFGGLHNSLTFRNLQLDFLFQFVKQQTFGYAPGVPGMNFNQLSGAANAWQEEGEDAPYQVLTSGSNGVAFNAYSRYALSDANIVDASYVRLKNISLSYNLSLKRSNGMQCRLYFQGQNLLTFTGYKGGDPEFRFSGYLPPLKVYSGGVQLTF